MNYEEVTNARMRSLEKQLETYSRIISTAVQKIDKLERRMNDGNNNTN